MTNLDRMVLKMGKKGLSIEQIDDEIGIGIDQVAAVYNDLIIYGLLTFEDSHLLSDGC